VAKTVDIRIPILDSVSDEAVTHALAVGREAVVVSLQQQGEYTIREAAQELGLTYERYLELLSEKGLPASQDDGDLHALNRLRQTLRR